MGFIQDISPIFKKKVLVFIDSYRESEDVYTFEFEKGADVSWKAGQHGIFTVTHKKIKKSTRPFSVASAPSEDRIKLTVGIKDNPSEFKQALLELKPGMTLSMRGPVGPLYLSDTSPKLLIAGGIGITPFRSILKQLESDENAGEHQMNLLYIDSRKSYVYQSELDEIAEKTSVNVHYLDSRDRLYEEINNFTVMYKDTARYYLAGPKSMVDAVSAYLKSQQVPKRSIKKDPFLGYKQ